MLRKLIVTTVIASLALFAGCKGRKPEASTGASSAGSSAPRKILNFGNGAEPQFVDPQLATGTVEFNLLRALFEGLVNKGIDGETIVPGVADHWDISDDKLVYTFHLRDNARWSDGTPVTVDDFLKSYQRMLTPELTADYSYMLFVVTGAEDFYHRKIDFSQTGFKKIDDHTLQLRLDKPVPYMLSALAYYPWYPVPIATVQKFNGITRRDSDWTRPENFVGNGPFKLASWRANQKIVATRSDTYWDKANVKLDEIDFFPVELADTEERMFRAGQLHVTNEMPLSKIALYQKEHPDQIHIDPFCGIYFYRFNTARKPLDDVRVRKALALSIDRDRIVQNVTQGGEIPAYSLVPPGLNGYQPTAKMQGGVAEARRLLAEAGYPNGKGFPHIELLYNTLEKHRVIAEAIQEMWRQNLGIDIGIYNEEWKVYLASQKSMNYTIQRAGWIGDYEDPYVFFDLWRTGGLNNNTNWGSPEYDRLLEESRSAKTQEERYATYQKMEKIFLDGAPILPIFFYTRPRLISPKVINFRSTYLDDYPWKYVDLAP